MRRDKRSIKTVAFFVTYGLSRRKVAYVQMFRCTEVMQAYVMHITRTNSLGIFDVRVADTGLAMFTDVGLPSDVDPYLLPTMMISLRAFVAVGDFLQLPVLGLQ